jgi:hypothetical protein
MSAKQARFVYASGVILSSATAILFCWIGGAGDSDWEIRLIFAVVFGTLTGLVLIPVSSLIQWISMRIIARKPNIPLRGQLLFANLPLLVLATLFLVCEFASTRPRARLKKWLSTNIPISVQNIEQGGRIGMSEVFFVLRFRISEADCNTLIEESGFAVADEHDRSRWEDQILGQAKMKVDLSESRVAARQKGRYTERIFFSRKYDEALFVISGY